MDTAATQVGYHATYDGIDFNEYAKTNLLTEDFVCAVRLESKEVPVGASAFPPGYVGKDGDVMRPAVFSCDADMRYELKRVCFGRVDVQCPWPVVNSVFRLFVVVAGLLGAAFFGLTLSKDKTRLTLLKVFLGALVLLATIACIIDSDRVGFVANRLSADPILGVPFYNPFFYFSARFVSVCVLDILCALEGVRSGPIEHFSTF